MTIIAPSLLASNFLQLQTECDMLNKSEADWFHLDVMDGTFVPNISFGLPVIEQIRKTTKKICDVHLMIVDPGHLTEAFKNAGADIITVHIEACPNLHRNIQQIKSLGLKAGVAVNPHTPINSLVDIIADVDLVNLMSVNPGFGGQQFIEQTYAKIRQLRQLINDKGLSVLIEIDGGVTMENAQQIIDAGADVLVAGSTVFKSSDPVHAISQLKKVGRS